MISVICCAHNEEMYVTMFLTYLKRSLRGFDHEIIFVADRCSDSTVDKAKRFDVKIIEKRWRNWRNSYAESLQLGLNHSSGDIISIMDVDLIVSRDFYKITIPYLKGSVASVSASLMTYPDTFLNRLIYAWEKTYRIAPLGKGLYGAARVIKREALEEAGGFRDVFSTDTDLDMRLEKLGYKSIVIEGVTVYHARHASIRSSIRRQIRLGRGRYMIGFGLLRTIGHSIFRLRPFVLAGWMMEWLQSS